MRQWRVPLILLRKARAVSQPAQRVESWLGARAVVLTACYLMLLDMSPSHMALYC